MVRTDRTHLRKVDLAPSKNISSLSYTKSMGLSLSPPQLLLPSGLIPPALSSRCSCPQPLQPSQKGKGLPFHCTNWEGSAEKGSGDCNLCLLWSKLTSKLTSPAQLWPGNLHPGSNFHPFFTPCFFFCNWILLIWNGFYTWSQSKFIILNLSLLIILRSLTANY